MGPFARCPPYKQAKRGADRLDVIDIVKTNHTPNLVSAEVYQIAKSEFLIWEGKKQELTTSHCACIWCPTSMNSCPQKLLKLAVSVPTNTWLRSVVKMLST